MDAICCPIEGGNHARSKALIEDSRAFNSLLNRKLARGTGDDDASTH